ncbi:MAG: PaaI family thioesterase [Alphaproteobacteria bacterium]|nr:PaaI family thioesterase [Alphaproteobacteria bacterium]
MTTEQDDSTTIDYVRGLVRDGIPHVRHLAIDVEAAAKGRLTLRLDYQERLVGNPENGVLHGGAITVLMDTVSGLAVITALPAPAPMATLDLRIDYLRPASPGQAVLGHAHCFKLTRSVAFTRGFAYQDDENDPIAHCTGAFMLATAGEAVPFVTGS